MWKRCWLYLIFIGRNDRRGTPIADQSFDEARDAVEQLILNTLGGLTKVRVIESWGRTVSWAEEQSTLLATITEDQQADQTIERCATTLAHSLVQDQVWVAKQQTDLFVSALND